MRNEKPIVAVDFDGTCVTHEFPDIGREIGAIPVLKTLTENGARLILFTMRSGKELDEAVNFLGDRGVELWGVNENPEQVSWTTSPKVYAQHYIDDAALGTKLWGKSNVRRPFVDWWVMCDRLLEAGLITQVQRTELRPQITKEVEKLDEK